MTQPIDLEALKAACAAKDAALEAWASWARREPENAGKDPLETILVDKTQGGKMCDVCCMSDSVSQEDVPREHLWHHDDCPVCMTVQALKQPLLAQLERLTARVRELGGPPGKQEWYSMEYFDKEAGDREPFSYPDEGGWVPCGACDGTLESARHAMKSYGDKHDVRVVYHARAIVAAADAAGVADE